RRIRGPLGARHLLLRGLRHRIVRVGEEIRRRLRLAELLAAAGRRAHPPAPRHLAWHGPHRGDLRRLRCPPGPCVRRWTAAYRPALLHQLGLTGVPAEGQRGLSRILAENVTLAGPAGALEAVIEWPDARPDPAACLVVCHPHPLHGGTMQ